MKKEFLLILLLFFFFSKKNIIYAKSIFYDQFTGQKIQVKITEEISTDAQVDHIIYFKEKGKFYKRIYKYLTPEMFGAKGDGKTDDYYAIQMMLDKGETGCTFYFNGQKTYYNAFANKGSWIEPLKRNIWQRHKGAKFLFNGAKIRRRMPEWNDKNAKGNYNEGLFYTDDHTSLLYLTGDNYVIDRADFNSNVPLGDLLDVNEKKTGIKDYAVGSCMEMGLWMESCSNVMITNSQFTNSVFPIYVTNGRNITFNHLTLKYAAQANKRINKDDPAIGGGIKLMNCNNIILNNVYGYRNLNDTVEIETLNTNITVTGKSDYDYDNSLVIISSQNIKIDWIANHVMHGTGLLIIGSTPNHDLETKNITGNITVDTTTWCGVLIWLHNIATHPISDINLNIKTSNTGYTGLFVNNESDKFQIKRLNITHTSINDGKGSGVSRMIHNSVEGYIKGSTIGAVTGIKVTGKSSKTPIATQLKFQNVKLQYDIAKSASLKIL